MIKVELHKMETLYRKYKEMGGSKQSIKFNIETALPLAYGDPE